jgi:holo-[acyl-carrier-protein] synthase
MKKALQIFGMGIDIVEIDDIRNARFKKRLAEYFLTKEEITHMPHGSKEDEFLASRFAVKEAVIKAFPEKLRPHDFVVTKKGVRPAIVFSLKKRELQYTVHISLSHTKHTAVAVALVARCE